MAAPEAEAPLMNGNVIDGKAVAARIRSEVAAAVAQMKKEHNRVPGLAVVIVGERKDSQTYVRMKKKACEEVGIVSFGADLPETATQDEVLAVVKEFNDNPDVHGILVQLPLPKHINEQVILGAVSLEKDVDGFHPLNVGHLTMKGREPRFVPCTPLGCIELLVRCGIPIKGKHAVVVGRSNIVGMPVAMLLNKKDATVTICHSGTANMADVVRSADIVVAACGQPEMIKGDWIKPGAAVIDVGTNPVPDESKKSGFRLVGDVDFAAAKEHAAAITPVPGGVGPMTITMLLSNTLKGAQSALQTQAQARAAPGTGAAPGIGATGSDAAGAHKGALGVSQWVPFTVGTLLVGALLREGVGFVGRAFGRRK